MVRLLVLIASLLLCVGLFLVSGSGASLVNFEERLGARGWTMSPQLAREERIIVVAIDEASLASIGPWPWARDQLATLVEAIDASGAQLQLHDIVYPEARPGDAALLASLQDARGAVIAQVPAIRPGQPVAAGQMTHPLSGIRCDNADGGLQLPLASGYLAPHSGFASIPKGHITPIISTDGAVRKSPAIICSGGQAYPALALTAFLQGSNFSPWQASIEAGRLPARSGLYPQARCLPRPRYSTRFRRQYENLLREGPLSLYRGLCSGRDQWQHRRRLTRKCLGAYRWHSLRHGRHRPHAL